MADASPTLYLVHLDVDVAAHPEPSPDLVELALAHDRHGQDLA